MINKVFNILTVNSGFTFSNMIDRRAGAALANENQLYISFISSRFSANFIRVTIIGGVTDTDCRGLVLIRGADLF